MICKIHFVLGLAENHQMQELSADISCFLYGSYFHTPAKHMFSEYTGISLSVHPCVYLTLCLSVCPSVYKMLVSVRELMAESKESTCPLVFMSKKWARTSDFSDTVIIKDE